MSSDDPESIRLLRQIAANTGVLAEAAPPKVRSWAWRLKNLVWLAITIAGALAGAGGAWLLAQL